MSTGINGIGEYLYVVGSVPSDETCMATLKKTVAQGNLEGFDGWDIYDLIDRFTYDPIKGNKMVKTPSIGRLDSGPTVIDEQMAEAIVFVDKGKGIIEDRFYGGLSTLIGAVVDEAVKEGILTVQPQKDSWLDRPTDFDGDTSASALHVKALCADIPDDDGSFMEFFRELEEQNMAEEYKRRSEDSDYGAHPEFWRSRLEGSADNWPFFKDFVDNANDNPRDKLMLDIMRRAMELSGNSGAGLNLLFMYQKEIGKSGDQFLAVMDMALGEIPEVPEEQVQDGPNPLKILTELRESIKSGRFNSVGWGYMKDRLGQMFRGGGGGLLYLDTNDNGFCDLDSGEVFGDSLAQDGINVKNLAEYDENGDGVIDESDSVFDQLRVWFDFNGDGKNQQSENFNLTSSLQNALDSEWWTWAKYEIPEQINLAYDEKGRWLSNDDSLVGKNMHCINNDGFLRANARVFTPYAEGDSFPDINFIYRIDMFLKAYHEAQGTSELLESPEEETGDQRLPIDEVA